MDFFIKYIDFRCKIDVCNATDYDGYIWSKKDKESCEYYEAEPDENGMCVQVDNKTELGCNGSYIFNDFEFERTTITQFNVLCDDKSFFRSVCIYHKTYECIIGF